MNEKEFWKILDKLDWNNEGDDDLVLKPVIKYLSKLKDEKLINITKRGQRCFITLLK